jgi:protein-tyrosine phosphatase
MRRITDSSLWLGHLGDARNLEGLHSEGIEAIVALAGEEPATPLARELISCRFTLIDGNGNPSWIIRAAVKSVVELLRADVKTLIHCGAGISRSPAIAGAAMALCRDCSFTEGLTLVIRDGRADFSPGFWSEIQSAFAEKSHGG